jgi:DNA invertase Pin-like site-specific DNA recombinase
MITILAGLAEFERELIRSRCGEGIERAKQRGVRFGRPKKLIAHQRQEALQRLEEGATQADVDFSEATISRLVARPFGGAQEEGLAA